MSDRPTGKMSIHPSACVGEEGGGCSSSDRDGDDWCEDGVRVGGGEE